MSCHLPDQRDGVAAGKYFSEKTKTGYHTLRSFCCNGKGLKSCSDFAEMTNFHCMEKSLDCVGKINLRYRVCWFPVGKMNFHHMVIGLDSVKERKIHTYIIYHQIKMNCYNCLKKLINQFLLIINTVLILGLNFSCFVKK